VKIPLETARQIATALGDSSNLYLAERAIADNFLYNEILKQVLALHAVEVINGLHQIELDALISRLRPRAPQAKAKAAARWAISQTDMHRDLFIRATCDACNQSMTFTGPAAGLRSEKFWHCGHGESVPAEILAQYAAQQNLPSAQVQADIEAREREMENYKIRQQNRIVPV